METVQRNMNLMILLEIGLTMVALFLFGGGTSVAMEDVPVNDRELATWDCAVGDECWKLTPVLKMTNRDTHRGVVCSSERVLKRRGFVGIRVVGHDEREAERPVAHKIEGRDDDGGECRPKTPEVFRIKSRDDVEREAKRPVAYRIEGRDDGRDEHGAKWPDVQDQGSRCC